MLVQPPGVPDESNLRVRFLLANRIVRCRRLARHPRTGASDYPEQLRFVDQRMFGGLAVSDGGAVVPPEIAHIARDPLDAEFDDDAFVRGCGAASRASSGSCSTRRRLGRRATSTPTRGSGWPGCTASGSARSSGGADVQRVLAGCREVMLAALGQGGTSFDALYVNVNGQSGYFDRSLEVYGREGEPCSRCGTPIRRITFMNRSSYFCPVCQPAPRLGGRPAAATGRVAFTQPTPRRT